MQDAVHSQPTWPEGVSILIGIGAQKAGTSWLHSLLSRHPACHSGPMKELHYFDTVLRKEPPQIRQRDRQLERLKAKDALNSRQGKRLQRLVDICAAPDANHQSYIDLLVEDVPPGEFAIDVTPGYASLPPRAFAEMAAIGPAHFVFIMREPVSRTWSAVRMQINLDEGSEGDYEDRCRAALDALLDEGDGQALRQSDYATVLAKLEANVPAERRLVLFFEDLFKPETAARLWDFLGAEPLPHSDLAPVNEGVRASMRPDQAARLIDRFRPQYDALCQAFGDAVPEAWHRRFAPETTAA